MDFEMAIWEMTSLLIAPKKVFKSIYYHVRRSSSKSAEHDSCCYSLYFESDANNNSTSTET